MSKEITLLHDLHTPDGTIPAGSRIEVSDARYDWLMECYLIHRDLEVKQMLKDKALIELIEGKQ